MHIVDWLLQYAFDQRASDIHMEPQRDQGVVRFRIDGVLHQVYQVPPGGDERDGRAPQAARAHGRGREAPAARRAHQDQGRSSAGRPRSRDAALRPCRPPSARSSSCASSTPRSWCASSAELGFSDKDGELWQSLVKRPYGIILVTGPTGSGKTTTLYSTLKQLATDAVNVSTVEDPIEMVDPALNQMQVQHGIDLGFADGLRALMRQDPDMIMVGEIRDKETADMAVQAALTGHLVFSTLHTNDAASSIARLLELGVPNYLLNATVIGVLAQRLVRMLCASCKAEDGPPDEALWKALVAPWRSQVPPTLWKPVGCLECRRTGYRGRTGLIELLVVSDAMRTLIAKGADLNQLRNQAARDGLRSLRVSGAEKAALGLTTIDEVMAAAPPFSD